jgi:hypothetical protein
MWHIVNDTLKAVRPSEFVGYDEAQAGSRVYLFLDGRVIQSKQVGIVLEGKYDGYLDDSKTSGGEPAHYGRQVIWSTKA